MHLVCSYAKLAEISRHSFVQSKPADAVLAYEQSRSKEALSAPGRGSLALYFETYSEYLANRGYSQVSYRKKTFLISEVSLRLGEETIAAGVPEPTIGARTMPILDVSKSHHLHGFALLQCASVGIVLHSAYDLVFR